MTNASEYVRGDYDTYACIRVDATPYDPDLNLGSDHDHAYDVDLDPNWRSQQGPGRGIGAAGEGHNASVIGPYPSGETRRPN